MPADIDTFNMLRPSVLESLTREQLLHELGRTFQMQARVSEYANEVTHILESRAAPPHQKDAAPTDTGGSEPAR